MPQIKSKFTTEERIAFDEKYNLGVYSHEAMIELLMQQDKRIEQLEERLMEVHEITYEHKINCIQTSA
jgi:DUF971 family protein